MAGRSGAAPRRHNRHDAGTGDERGAPRADRRDRLGDRAARHYRCPSRRYRRRAPPSRDGDRRPSARRGGDDCRAVRKNRDDHRSSWPRPRRHHDTRVDGKGTGARLSPPRIRSRSPPGARCASDHGRREWNLVARVPVVRFGRILVATVQEDLYDRDALQLQADLAGALERTGAHGVLIDLSTVEMVDSFLGRLIGEIAAVSRLMGAHTVVAGIQPAVALTLVELGLSLPGVQTALNADKGHALLRQLVNEDWFGRNGTHHG